MIKKLTVYNFRCFENTTIVFQDVSILVGRNNAGKSTLIEALKIISTVVRKYRNLSFTRPPEWVANETDNGVSPSMENQNISDKGIFNMYGNPPAVIGAFFSNGCSIRAYVGDRLSIFALLIGKDGIPVRSVREAKQLEFPPVEVLPQISALIENEKLISRSTVVQNRCTRLASRNFRNQLYYCGEKFPHFKELVEATWEGLQVNPVETSFNDEGQFLRFLVRNNDFTAEIGWMGHGLQMWVQCMWFLSQCSEDAVVILDEPDVYMHADLQRRLIRLVSHMFSQLIVATHSIEIMEEVLPESIIPVNNKRRVVKSIGSHSLLQKQVEDMGSIVNIDLSRLFISHRFMIWEGRDTDRLILSGFQAVLYPKGLTAISSFPKTFVEGWGGWQRAMAVAGVFNLNRIHVSCYCIFDSDYHSEEAIQSRTQEAIKHHINLHIWRMKEIENYVLCPEVITRYISSKKRKGKVSLDIVLDKMTELANHMKESVVDNIATNLQEEDNSLAFKTAKQRAEIILHKRWGNPMGVVPGKEFLKQLSSWSQAEFGVGFNALNIIPVFKAEEVPDEIKKVVKSIVEGMPF